MVFPKFGLIAIFWLACSFPFFFLPQTRFYLFIGLFWHMHSMELAQSLGKPFLKLPNLREKEDGRKLDPLDNIYDKILDFRLYMFEVFLILKKYTLSQKSSTSEKKLGINISLIT